jgi:uncharacterized protein GlcG (DUF336 family)
MPLNTNLLRGSAGIELPDQLSRMATVEQIRSAQMNQETARLNQQARELELADKEEAKTILNQVSSQIKSEEDLPKARSLITGLQSHPNKIVRDVGAQLRKDLDIYDAEEAYIKANPGKVKVGDLSGPSVQPAPVNNLAPQTGASNALIPSEFQTAVSEERDKANRMARYWEMRSLRDSKYATQAKDARDHANKFGGIQEFGQGKLVMGPGGVSMLTPEQKSSLAQIIAERDALSANNPNRRIYDEKIRQMTTHPAPVNVNVSTEKAYSGALAGALAKSDVDLRDAALNAPEAAGNANRILEVLSSGNIIAGPGAEWKLKTAKLLNAFGVAGFVGKDNTELISNTEQLQKSLASQTLDSIKTSGLGAGNGFTNADRDFLEKAKSGNIDMTPETLRRTAELARRSAEATAEKWNTRVKQIPKSAVEGTGLSVEPVGLPSKFESRKSVASQPTMTATNPKTGERIESSDGGQTWNPVGGKK